MNQEEWRSVSGYEGMYEVSSLGNVRSIPRIAPGGRRLKGTLLRPGITKWGYPHVSFTKNSIGRSFRVHRLVADAFLANPSNLAEVDHVDGNKLNNALANLQRVSRLENVRRAWKNGLYPHIVGEAHKKAKLTEKQVIWLRQQAFTDPSFNQSEAARKLGIGVGTVNHAISGRSWKHL